MKHSPLNQFLQRALITGSLLAAATIPARATVYFQNTGTTSGWDYITTQSQGTITNVSNCYKGTPGVRCQQIYQTGGNGLRC